MLLAHMAEGEIESVLDGPLQIVASHTIVDADQLREDLEKIRTLGYAVSYEETDEGVAGVSVPIRDHLDRVVASLTVSGPATHLRRSTMGRNIDIALDGAKLIGADIGHRPASVGAAAK